MEASLAATGMLDVLATSAVLFMMLSTLPSTSIVSCWGRKVVKSNNGNVKASRDVHLGSDL